MITIAQALETGAVVSESVRWLIGQGALGFLAAVSMAVNAVQWRKNEAMQAKFDALQASRVTEAQEGQAAALRVQTRLIEKVSNRDTGRPRRKESSDDREG